MGDDGLAAVLPGLLPDERGEELLASLRRDAGNCLPSEPIQCVPPQGLFVVVQGALLQPALRHLHLLALDPRLRVVAERQIAGSPLVGQGACSSGVLGGVQSSRRASAASRVGKLSWRLRVRLRPSEFAGSTGDWEAVGVALRLLPDHLVGLHRLAPVPLLRLVCLDPCHVRPPPSGRRAAGVRNDHDQRQSRAAGNPVDSVRPGVGVVVGVLVVVDRGPVRIDNPHRTSAPDQRLHEVVLYVLGREWQPEPFSRIHEQPVSMALRVILDTHVPQVLITAPSRPPAKAAAGEQPGPILRSATPAEGRAVEF